MVDKIFGLPGKWKDKPIGATMDVKRLTEEWNERLILEINQLVEKMG